MAIVERDEWEKLHIAKINGWIVALSGSQHVLGWLIISPPRHIEGSLVNLTDEELIEFKKIAKVGEELLDELFSPDLYNYSITGNIVKDLHVHLQPRYSSPREFGNYRFVDENWGKAVRFLPYNRLPQRETVFELVDVLRENLGKKKIKGLDIEISKVV